MATKNVAKMKANKYYMHFARSPDGSLVSFCYDLLLMRLYRVKFGEDRSSSFDGIQINKWNVSAR